MVAAAIGQRLGRELATDLDSLIIGRDCDGNDENLWLEVGNDSAVRRKHALEMGFGYGSEPKETLSCPHIGHKQLHMFTSVVRGMLYGLWVKVWHLVCLPHLTFLRRTVWMISVEMGGGIML